MPMRGSLLFFIGCLMFGSAEAGAQARNPHTAVAAPQMAKPVPQAGPIRRPGIPPNPALPTQVAPATVNGRMPASPPAQAQPAQTVQGQPAQQTVEAPQLPAQMPPKPP